VDEICPSSTAKFVVAGDFTSSPTGTEPGAPTTYRDVILVHPSSLVLGTLDPASRTVAWRCRQDVEEEVLAAARLPSPNGGPDSLALLSRRGIALASYVDEARTADAPSPWGAGHLRVSRSLAPGPPEGSAARPTGVDASPAPRLWADGDGRGVLTDAWNDCLTWLPLDQAGAASDTVPLRTVCEAAAPRAGPGGGWKAGPAPGAPRGASHVELAERLWAQTQRGPGDVGPGAGAAGAPGSAGGSSTPPYMVDLPRTPGGEGAGWRPGASGWDVAPRAGGGGAEPPGMWPDEGGAPARAPPGPRPRADLGIGPDVPVYDAGLGDARRAGPGREPPGLSGAVAVSDCVVVPGGARGRGGATRVVAVLVAEAGGSKASSGLVVLASNGGRGSPLPTPAAARPPVPAGGSGALQDLLGRLPPPPSVARPSSGEEPGPHGSGLAPLPVCGGAPGALGPSHVTLPGSPERVTLAGEVGPGRCLVLLAGGREVSLALLAVGGSLLSRAADCTGAEGGAPAWPGPAWVPGAWSLEVLCTCQVTPTLARGRLAVAPCATRRPPRAPPGAAAAGPGDDGRPRAPASFGCVVADGLGGGVVVEALAALDDGPRASSGETDPEAPPAPLAVTATLRLGPLPGAGLLSPGGGVGGGGAAASVALALAAGGPGGTVPPPPVSMACVGAPPGEPGSAVPGSGALVLCVGGSAPVLARFTTSRSARAAGSCSHGRAPLPAPPAPPGRPRRASSGAGEAASPRGDLRSHPLEATAGAESPGSPMSSDAEAPSPRAGASPAPAARPPAPAPLCPSCQARGAARWRVRGAEATGALGCVEDVSLAATGRGPRVLLASCSQPGSVVELTPAAPATVLARGGDAVPGVEGVWGVRLGPGSSLVVVSAGPRPVFLEAVRRPGLELDVRDVSAGALGGGPWAPGWGRGVHCGRVGGAAGGGALVGLVTGAGHLALAEASLGGPRGLRDVALRWVAAPGPAPAVAGGVRVAAGGGPLVATVAQGGGTEVAVWAWAGEGAARVAPVAVAGTGAEVTCLAVAGAGEAGTAVVAAGTRGPAIELLDLREEPEERMEREFGSLEIGREAPARGPPAGGRPGWRLAGRRRVELGAPALRRLGGADSALVPESVLLSADGGAGRYALAGLRGGWVVRLALGPAPGAPPRDAGAAVEPLGAAGLVRLVARAGSLPVALTPLEGGAALAVSSQAWRVRVAGDGPGPPGADMAPAPLPDLLPFLAEVGPGRPGDGRGSVVLGVDAETRALVLAAVRAGTEVRHLPLTAARPAEGAGAGAGAGGPPPAGAARARLRPFRVATDPGLPGLASALCVAAEGDTVGGGRGSDSGDGGAGGGGGRAPGTVVDAPAQEQAMGAAARGPAGRAHTTPPPQAPAPSLGDRRPEPVRSHPLRPTPPLGPASEPPAPHPLPPTWDAGRGAGGLSPRSGGGGAGDLPPPAEPPAVPPHLRPHPAELVMGTVRRGAEVAGGPAEAEAGTPPPGPHGAGQWWPGVRAPGRRGGARRSERPGFFLSVFPRGGGGSQPSSPPPARGAPSWGQRSQSAKRARHERPSLRARPGSSFEAPRAKVRRSGSEGGAGVRGGAGPPAGGPGSEGTAGGDARLPGDWEEGFSVRFPSFERPVCVALSSLGAPAAASPGAGGRGRGAGAGHGEAGRWPGAGGRPPRASTGGAEPAPGAVEGLASEGGLWGHLVQGGRASPPLPGSPGPSTASASPPGGAGAGSAESVGEVSSASERGPGAGAPEQSDAASVGEGDAPEAWPSAGAGDAGGVDASRGVVLVGTEVDTALASRATGAWIQDLRVFLSALDEGLLSRNVRRGRGEGGLLGRILMFGFRGGAPGEPPPAGGLVLLDSVMVQGPVLALRALGGDRLLVSMRRKVFSLAVDRRRGKLSGPCGLGALRFPAVCLGAAEGAEGAEGAVAYGMPDGRVCTAPAPRGSLEAGPPALTGAAPRAGGSAPGAAAATRAGAVARGGGPRGRWEVVDGPVAPGAAGAPDRAASPPPGVRPGCLDLPWARWGGVRAVACPPSGAGVAALADVDHPVAGRGCLLAVAGLHGGEAGGDAPAGLPSRLGGRLAPFLRVPEGGAGAPAGGAAAEGTLVAPIPAPAAVAPSAGEGGRMAAGVSLWLPGEAAGGMVGEGGWWVDDRLGGGAPAPGFTVATRSGRVLSARPLAPASSFPLLKAFEAAALRRVPGLAALRVGGELPGGASASALVAPGLGEGLAAGAAGGAAGEVGGGLWGAVAGAGWLGAVCGRTLRRALSRPWPEVLSVGEDATGLLAGSGAEGGALSAAEVVAAVMGAALGAGP